MLRCFFSNSNVCGQRLYLTTGTSSCLAVLLLFLLMTPCVQSTSSCRKSLMSLPMKPQLSMSRTWSFVWPETTAQRALSSSVEKTSISLGDTVNASLLLSRLRGNSTSRISHRNRTKRRATAKMRSTWLTSQTPLLIWPERNVYHSSHFPSVTASTGEFAPSQFRKW